MGTVAGIITAVGVVITAIGGLVGTLTVLIPILRQTREIHTIVNQERTDRMRYQRVLIRALEARGIDIPEDQSVEDSS